jgi:alginate O-acetyltransferase complex protein AlgI
MVTMPFTSIQFILFFSVIATVYFVIPLRWRIPYIFVTSCIFYSYSGPLFLLLLLLSTYIDFKLALGIERAKNAVQRRRLLIIGIALNVTILFVFKYLNAILLSLNEIYHTLQVPNTPSTQLISSLAPGVSFYTFMKIAYLVDVYRRKSEAERKLITFGAFVMFFPHIISGPINRAEQLIPQFQHSIRFDYERVIEALRLILWGVFKKIVVADTLARFVNEVYGNPYAYNGLSLAVATLFLAFQIYADFSGYTDIALGTAYLLGFKMIPNFRQPYFSHSVLEFWRRWHISLTMWIREYLFFPFARYLLIRTKRRFPRVVEVIMYMIVMSLVGLWHGANWTFLVWGILHGVYMSVETVLAAKHVHLLPATRSAYVMKVVITFLLISVAWVFFRAETLQEAIYILSHMFDISNGLLSSLEVHFVFGGTNSLTLILSACLIALLVGVDWIDTKWGFMYVLKNAPVIARWTYYYAIIAAIFGTLISVKVIQDFVYFQF